MVGSLPCPCPALSDRSPGPLLTVAAVSTGPALLPLGPRGACPSVRSRDLRGVGPPEGGSWRGWGGPHTRLRAGPPSPQDPPSHGARLDQGSGKDTRASSGRRDGGWVGAHCVVGSAARAASGPGARGTSSRPAPLAQMPRARGPPQSSCLPGPAHRCMGLLQSCPESRTLPEEQWAWDRSFQEPQSECGARELVGCVGEAPALSPRPGLAGSQREGLWPQGLCAPGFLDAGYHSSLVSAAAEPRRDFWSPGGRGQPGRSPGCP